MSKTKVNPPKQPISQVKPSSAEVVFFRSFGKSFFKKSSMVYFVMSVFCHAIFTSDI